MSKRPALGWTALVAIMLPTVLTAQENVSDLRWSAVLYYDAQQVARSPYAYWHTITAGVQRKLDGGSIAIQSVATRRFNIDDHALVADVYHDLWRGAYGNARLRYAPDAEALPSSTIGGEIVQVVASSEISASYQHQEFAIADVNTIGLGLGFYIGNWYLRPRSLVAQIEDSWSPFLAFTARRYLGDTTDNSFDFSVGLGEEVLEVAPPLTSTRTVDVITTGSRFAAVKTQRFFGRHLGAVVGATYSDYVDISTRWGLSVGVITRW